MESFEQGIDEKILGNQRIKNLFLILIFVFVASGVALTLLSQVQSYDREQVYLATESALPRHKQSTKPSPPAPLLLESEPRSRRPEGEGGMQGWKTYRNEEYGFEIKYPEVWRKDTKTIDQITDKNEGLLYGASHFALYSDKNKKLEIFLLEQGKFSSGNLKYVKSKLLGTQLWEIYISIDGPGKGTEYYFYTDEIDKRIIVQVGVYDFLNVPAEKDFTQISEQILSTFKFIK